MLHGLYLSVYVAPGLDEEDYAFLQVLSSPPSEDRPNGGFIYRFVELGGLAVINVAPHPTLPNSTQTAPQPGAARRRLPSRR